MADTLAANVAELTQDLIVATLALMGQDAPLMNLVTRQNLGKGHNRLLVPRVNATFSVQTPTEGDEIVTSSQFDLTSSTLAPTLRAIMVRVSERAEYFSKEDILTFVSRELARAQAQDVDTDIGAEFVNFGGTDIGATNRNLRIADVRRGNRQLMAVTPANGGPAMGQKYLVISPMQEEMLLADAGGLGQLSTAGTNTAPWIPQGLSQDIIDNYFVGRWFGIPVFRDGYIVSVGSAFSGGLFTKNVITLAMSKDWDMKTFDVPNWIGPVIRCVADYNSGVTGFSQHGIEVLSNDTAP